MKIDVQCHVFPDAYRELLLQHSVFPTAVKQNEDILLDYEGKQKFLISKEKYDPANIIREMDTNGIDIAMISCNLPDVCLLPKELQAGAAKLINDGIKEICDHYPDRFFGIASIPWEDKESALTEVQRVKKLGFRSVMVFSRAGEMNVDDESIIPVYELCEKLQLPLTIHPSIPAWFRYVSDYSMIPMLSFQMDSSLALMRLILSGIIERLNDLKVIMPHAGGVLPYMDGRIKYQTEIMKRGISNITVPATEQLRKGRIWYDTVSPSVESLLYIYNYAGADKILFGTDYPFISTKFFADLICECGFTEEEMEKIFWKNADQIYNLGVS